VVKDEQATAVLYNRNKEENYQVKYSTATKKTGRYALGGTTCYTMYILSEWFADWLATWIKNKKHYMGFFLLK